MAFNAGEVMATLGFRVNPAGLAAYEAGLNKATAAAGRAEKATAASAVSSGKAAGAMGALGTVAKGGAAAGLVALGTAAVYSVKKSMDLQKALAEVQAVTKANTTQMAAYKAKAIEVGTATGVGATQAAGALAELAKGGLSVKDTLTALDGTIALAQSSGMGFADSATTVVKALSTFNLKGNQATMVADGLASAAAKTSMDVSDFAQAFAQGGAAAAAAGLNFDETVNVMGAMANKFQSGSDMGTSLKTTLTQLAHPTKRAQTAMRDLGIDVWQASGKIKPAAELVKLLGDKFAGMTNKQKLATAATIAGTDGMRTLLALSSSTGGKIREVGSAQQMAADKTNNLEGNLQKLKAQFDALAISAGDEIVPKLTEATKSVTKFFDEFRKGEGNGGKFKQGAKDTVDGISWIDNAIGNLQDATLGNLITMGERSKQVLDHIFSGFDQKKSPWHPVIEPKLKPESLIKQLDSMAVLAKSSGIAQFRINAVLYGDQPVKARLQAMRALVAGVKPAIVQAILEGDQPVRVRIAALKALTSKANPFAVSAVISGDNTVRVKLAALSALAAGVPPAKVFAAISGDASTKNKLHALQVAVEAIPGTSRVLSSVSGAEGARSSLMSVAQAAFAIPTSTHTTVTTDIVKNYITTHKDYSPLTKNPPGNATGRGPGAAQRSLVGEGAGGEWVGNEQDGWRWIGGPALMDLRPQDAVIPTEPRYAGNAIGFLRQMYGAEAARVAHEMGVAGYKKGKAAKKKARYIPSHVYAKHSTEYYDGVVQNLTSAAAERTSKGKLTPAAKRAKAALGKAKKERDAAHKYADQISTATGEADIFADQMQQADLRDDQGAYNTAFAGRKKQIQKAIDLLKVAVKLGPKGGAWAQSMRKQLSSLGVDVLAKPEDVVDKAADPTTYSDAEQKILDKLNSDEALAALTETTTDDIAAETAKRDWLQGILADAIRNPAARGGASAITAIAGELKSTTDSLANLTKAPDVSADLQAQIDQGKERERIANANAAVNAGVLAAFTGAGDIGAGGPNAYRAAGGVTVNFQSTLAPSPAEARRAADLVVGGIGYQGAPPSPRQVV